MDLDIQDFETAMLIAATSLLAALVSGVLTQRGQLRVTQMKDTIEQKRLTESRQIEIEKYMDKYRQPLARSTYELQSRLYNIVKNKFLVTSFQKQDIELERYALSSTLYLFAQFFSWREIIRREVQFIDFNSDEDSRKLSELEESISTCFARFRCDGKPLGPHIQIFRGHQRAIGEKMIVNDGKNCMPMSYASFFENDDEKFRYWFNRLEHDLRDAAQNPDLIAERLLQLQHSLNDLLDFLDPEFARFPKRYRSRV